LSSVVLKRFENAWEAHIARGRLEAENIASYVTNEHHCTANWTLVQALGLVELRVPESAASKAELILEQHEAGTYQKDLISVDSAAGEIICADCS